MSKTILETAIACMDAAYDAAPEDCLANSEILTMSDELIAKFKKKWNIKKDIGNADVWETDDGTVRKDYEKLEMELFELSWGWMKELMLNCGVGDIANEVLLSETFGITPSWEKKEKVNV